MKFLIGLILSLNVSVIANATDLNVNCSGTVDGKEITVATITEAKSTYLTVKANDGQGTKYIVNGVIQNQQNLVAVGALVEPVEMKPAAIGFHLTINKDASVLRLTNLLGGDDITSPTPLSCR